MIKVKTKTVDKWINVLNIVSVQQDEKGDVCILITNGMKIHTTLEIDVVTSKIEKMLIFMAGGERV